MRAVLSMACLLKSGENSASEGTYAVFAMTAMGILQAKDFLYLVVRCCFTAGRLLPMSRDPKSRRERMTVRAPKPRPIAATGISQATFKKICVISILACDCRKSVLGVWHAAHNARDSPPANPKCICCCAGLPERPTDDAPCNDTLPALYQVTSLLSSAGISRALCACCGSGAADVTARLGLQPTNSLRAWKARGSSLGARDAA